MVQTDNQDRPINAVKIVKASGRVEVLHGGGGP
jgi:hypothetical protein